MIDAGFSHLFAQRIPNRMQRNPHLMKTFIARLSCVFALLAVLCGGCGKKNTAPVLVPIDPAAFNNAAPQIKQMWEKSIAEASSNEFGSAIMTLRLMSREVDYPADRWQVVRNATLSYEDQLRKKAAAGDESARKEMEKIGVSPNPPQK
jgi:hypothetical protein